MLNLILVLFVLCDCMNLTTRYVIEKCPIQICSNLLLSVLGLILVTCFINLILLIFKAVLLAVNYFFLIKILFSNFIKQFSFALEINMLVLSGMETGYEIVFTANERSLLCTKKVKE